jgi:hypothetical protein
VKRNTPSVKTALSIFASGNQSHLICLRRLARDWKERWGHQAPWDKGHGKLVRRRLKSVSLSPQDSGLCGCSRLFQMKWLWWERLPAGNGS